MLKNDKLMLFLKFCGGGGLGTERGKVQKGKMTGGIGLRFLR